MACIPQWCQATTITISRTISPGGSIRYAYCIDDIETKKKCKKRNRAWSRSEDKMKGILVLCEEGHGRCTLNCQRKLHRDQLIGTGIAKGGAVGAVHGCDLLGRPKRGFRGDPQDSEGGFITDFQPAGVDRPLLMPSVEPSLALSGL